MKEISRHIISAKYKIQSLCWRGDELVDVAAGHVRYRLDGTHANTNWGAFGKPFNRCLSSTKGNYAVVYDLLGTKGLVFKGTELIREINRSYYHADVYEYPVAFINSPSGRVLLAHCPEEYSRLEIEDAETGERLTSRTCKPLDFFHSRLQATLDGKYLLSAGWVWHPADVVRVFEIENILKNPELLDSPANEGESWLNIGDLEFDLFEINNAAFNGTTQIVWLGGNGENSPHQIIGIYDLEKKQTLSVARVEKTAGILMPMGDLAVDFFEHPKLLELKTGKVVHLWNDIPSGLECSSIIHHIPLPPQIALDPINKRFAVATEDVITVIQLG